MWCLVVHQRICWVWGGDKFKGWHCRWVEGWWWDRTVGWFHRGGMVQRMVVLICWVNMSWLKRS